MGQGQLWWGEQVQGEVGSAMQQGSLCGVHWGKRGAAVEGWGCNRRGGQYSAGGVQGTRVHWLWWRGGWGGVKGDCNVREWLYKAQGVFWG